MLLLGQGELLDISEARRTPNSPESQTVGEQRAAVIEAYLPQLHPHRGRRLDALLRSCRQATTLQLYLYALRYKVAPVGLFILAVHRLTVTKVSQHKPV